MVQVQSAFMIDLNQVSYALRNSTPRSLLILDEFGKGTLPMKRFQNYLVQDYLFLIQFARATALSAYKYKSMDKIGEAAANLASVRQETTMHLTFCEGFGLSKEMVEGQEESQGKLFRHRFVVELDTD